jgi:hypothetical protein
VNNCALYYLLKDKMDQQIYVSRNGSDVANDIRERDEISSWRDLTNEVVA